MIEINDCTIRSQRSSVVVVIEKHAWNKMHGWCKAATSEVSGWGLVYKDENGRYKVYDVFLPRQQCSSGYTDIDDDAASKLRFKKFKQNKIPLNHWRFWWHTHYNFGTFWSGTDNATVEKLLLKGGHATQDEFLISLVINQKGDWLLRADFLHPTHVTIDKLQVYTCPNSRYRPRKTAHNYKSDIKRWVRPLGADAKVSDENEIKTVTPQYSFPSYGGYGRYMDDTPRFEFDIKAKGSYQEQLTVWLDEHYPNRHDWKKNDDHWVNDGGVWRMRSDEELKAFREKKSDGVTTFGSTHILHPNTGKLMRQETWDAIKGCACGDNTCKQCLEIIAGQTATPKEEEKPNTEDKVKCECPHSGVWEVCTCVAECFVCNEMMMSGFAH
jgi:hypothetical protein